MPLKTPKTTAPCFVTHREINSLVGERRRLRWEKDGLLPKPDWIKADRSRLAIYPDLALARVVVGATKDLNEQRALDGIVPSCQTLLKGMGYRHLRDVARDALAVVSREDDWDFARFLRVLSEADPDVLESWRADVVEMEERLSARAALSFRSIPGTVKAEIKDGYTIDAADAIERQIHGALAKLDIGGSVVLERIGVESKEREFVLPALSIVIDSADEELGQEGADHMEQRQIDPFELIASRAPLSAASYLGASADTPELNVREEFERGFIPGLLLEEDEAPYVEAAQTFSFVFDSDLLGAHVPA